MEMMHHEAGVKVVAVGDLPIKGSMQAPSGTQGALIYDTDDLDTDIGNVSEGHRRCLCDNHKHQPSRPDPTKRKYPAPIRIRSSRLLNLPYSSNCLELFCALAICCRRHFGAIQVSVSKVRRISQPLDSIPLILLARRHRQHQAHSRLQT